MLPGVQLYYDVGSKMYVYVVYIINLLCVNVRKAMKLRQNYRQLLFTTPREILVNLVTWWVWCGCGVLRYGLINMV